MLTIKYLTTLLLALAASTPALGYDIQFRRFHDEKCAEPMGEEHRSRVFGPGMHIVSGKCVNFDDYDDGFHSYSFHRRGPDHQMTKMCDVVVYPETDCMGHELKKAVATDINDGGMDNSCIKTGRQEGRSVLVDCINR